MNFFQRVGKTLTNLEAIAAEGRKIIEEKQYRALIYKQLQEELHKSVLANVKGLFIQIGIIIIALLISKHSNNLWPFRITIWLIILWSICNSLRGLHAGFKLWEEYQQWRPILDCFEVSIGGIVFSVISLVILLFSLNFFKGTLIYPEIKDTKYLLFNTYSLPEYKTNISMDTTNTSIVRTKIDTSKISISATSDTVSKRQPVKLAEPVTNNKSLTLGTHSLEGVAIERIKIGGNINMITLIILLIASILITIVVTTKVVVIKCRQELQQKNALLKQKMDSMKTTDLFWCTPETNPINPIHEPGLLVGYYGIFIPEQDINAIKLLGKTIDINKHKICRAGDMGIKIDDELPIPYIFIDIAKGRGYFNVTELSEIINKG
ncbi:MAG: hypothetical protein WC614_13470 [bacterium]